MMKTNDLFTKQRERQEAKLGAIPTKDQERKQLAADTEAFLTKGGKIHKVENEATHYEKLLAKSQKKKKLSEKEIDCRLKEFARTGKVTIQ